MPQNMLPRFFGCTCAGAFGSVHATPFAAFPVVVASGGGGVKSEACEMFGYDCGGIVNSRGTVSVLKSTNDGRSTRPTRSAEDRPSIVANGASACASCAMFE